MWSSGAIYQPYVFECATAVQVWALSKIPSNPNVFPSIIVRRHGSLVLEDIPDHVFASILWYIWKARNNIGFSNLDVNPRDTLKLAETKSRLWTEAQDSLTHNTSQHRLTVKSVLTTISGRWCFTNGSWKAHENFSGQKMV